MGSAAGLHLIHLLVKSGFCLMLALCSVGDAILAFDELCDQIKLDLYGAENRALQHSAYENAVANTPVLCGRNCHVDARCKSFNYQMLTRICELNNAMRAGQLEDFTEVAGSVYFDADKDTPLLSVYIPDARYSSCKKLFKAGYHQNGVYTIYFEGFESGVRVYCDMETAGGGWIVFQRRQDGSENFYRNWTAYETGFGNLFGEFWLGNAIINRLFLSGGSWQMRIVLEDWEGNTKWARYEGVRLEGATYQLHFQNFDSNSTAGKSLWEYLHFSTMDQNNHPSPSRNCGLEGKAGWWFGNCGYSNLNGEYYDRGQSVPREKGIFWNSWKGYHYSLKGCTMAISEI